MEKVLFSDAFDEVSSCDSSDSRFLLETTLFADFAYRDFISCKNAFTFNYFVEKLDALDYALGISPVSNSSYVFLFALSVLSRLNSNYKKYYKLFVSKGGF